MSALTRRAAPVATATALCVLLLGCDSAQDAEAAACDQAVETRQAVQELAELDARSATGDDVRDAVERIGQELTELRGAVDDVVRDRLDEVDSALGELRGTLEGLGDQPLTEARQSIASAMDDVATTWDAAWAALDCD